MGNHSARNTAPIKHPPSRSPSRGRYGYLALVVLAGIGIWFIRPHLVLSSSKTALLDVKTGGLGSKLSATATTANGTSIPLSVKNGALWPEKPLQPNTVVNVTVHDAGFLGWTTTTQKSVVTPPTPRLVSDVVSVPLNSAVDVTYKEPVSEVVLLPTKKVERINGVRNVTIAPAPTRPNQSGVLDVATRARSWELLGPAETVSWKSVPWVTATLGQVTASAGNASTAALKVTFSAPLAHADVSQWHMSPSISGSWHKVNDQTYEFKPAGIGFTPATNVTVSIPGSTTGPSAKDGSFLASATTLNYPIPPGLTQTMQEWLAELGYLPLRFTPDSSTSLATWNEAYTAPQGTFAWKYAKVPVSLENLWNPTSWSVVTQGAVYSFEHQHGLALTPTPGASFWNALRTAVQNHDVDTTPYAYVYVSETLPERLWLYVSGKVILKTLTNTGIPQTPTSIGTFPVQIRTTFQTMKGKNPDGTPYADAVHWINYFHGSEAVHGFLRAQYGFPQSLGCVEVPIPIAQKIYPHLYVGALVTVQSTGSQPIQLVPPANPNN